MKNIFYSLALAGTLMSCGAAMRTMGGATESKLIETVAVEQGFQREIVKIIDKSKNSGNATYALDVCGKRMVYKQIGSVFMESGKAESMFQK